MGFVEAEAYWHFLELIRFRRPVTWFRATRNRFARFGTAHAFSLCRVDEECSKGFRGKGKIMLRKTVVGLFAVASLLIASVGTASANGHCGHHHGGYGYGGGFRGGHGYGGYAPRVMFPGPPVYAYPPVVGYGYGAQPGYGPGYGYGYGYARPGLGISTPGFGLYFR